jgi:type VI secretion system secreted protein Hcp
MAENAFVEVPGVMGSSQIKGREGWIVAFAVDHAIGSTRDASGYPDKTKTARHLVVTKEIDPASTKLQELAHKGEEIKTVTVRFYRMAPGGGGEENYYTIAIGDVRIDSIRTVQLFNKLESQTLMPQYEQVTFAYKNAKFVFSTGGREYGSKSASKVNNESAVLIYDTLSPLNDGVGELVKEVVSGAISDAWDGAKGGMGELISAAMKKAWEDGEGKPPAPPPGG